MELKLSGYEPIAQNWHEFNLRYQGDGFAQFTSPEGVVRGRGRHMDCGDRNTGFALSHGIRSIVIT